MSQKAVGLSGLLVLVVCGALTFGQRQGRGQSQTQVPRTPAPKTEGKYWSLAELSKHEADIIASKQTNWSFFQEDTYQTEMRHVVGPQRVLIHGKRADFMFIKSGGGTFTMGGQPVDSKPTPNTPGDFAASSIRGGVSHELNPGDVVFIPPGIPHHFSETNPGGVTEILVRWDPK